MHRGSDRERARAKINLFLHIVGRRADGYHELDSIFAFADAGDEVSVQPAEGISLQIDGPYGDSLEADQDNLVLRAARSLAQYTGATEGAALRLAKTLPVASGIGGGSADAAATLRLLNRHWGLGLDAPALEKLALRLGADVPACVRSQPVRVEGIGERLTPLTTAPQGPLVLVNPNVKLPTPNVFARYRDISPGFDISLTDLPADAFHPDWLAQHTRNSLWPAALDLAPVLADVVDRINAAAPILPARLSGSGATCWGWFASRQQAQDAADTIANARPDWWVCLAEWADQATESG